MLHISSKQSVYSLLKHSIYIAGCGLFIGCTSPTPDTTASLLTFNIRYDNPGDGLDAWPNRSSWVAAVIDSSGASVVGLQEALEHQLDEVIRLAPRFAYVGVGRDDGVDAGEFSPLLYDSSVWTVVSWQTRWLSPDSSAVGIAGWDAALPRIATVVDLLHQETSSSLRVINTHFDHRGSEARLESARLIFNWALEVKGPVVVMGDFNFEDSTPAYHQLVGNDLKTGLGDVARLFQKTDDATFRGFDANNTLGPRIDYVFVNQNVTALSYNVLAPIRGGRFPSDHLPVQVTVQF